jgi:hypothetical protein
MGFLSKIFGKKEMPSAKDPKHAVVVNFQYGSTDLQPMFDLEARLEAAICEANVGEFDGNEIAVDGSDGSFYMYGPDADRLFDAVRPILESSDFMKGAMVTLQYCPSRDGIGERQVRIGS